MQPTEHHIDISQPDSLALPLLAEASGLSNNQVKLAMKKGAVWVTDGSGTHRLRRAKKTLSAGTVLHMYYSPNVLNAEIPAPICVADEGDYSVWVKPRGVMSQGSKWGDHCAIARWVEIHDQKQRPGFIVHRLDRAATGLILIAHSKQATRLLTAMFQNKTLDKKYHAIVRGQFAPHHEELEIDTCIDNRSACSRVRQLEFSPDNQLSLVEVRIQTGRKHQIRKHLSERGFPIVGDRLYGGGKDIDLQLAAVTLSFRCPVTGKDRNYVLSEELRPRLDSLFPK